MKQRGIQTLYRQIFVEDSSNPDSKRKGRNEHLNNRRNDCLIDRYFWYGKFSGLRYDLIIKALSEEFFLTEVTVPRIVEDNFEKLAALKQMKPDKKYFLKKWPHLTWPDKIGVNALTS